MRNLWTVLKFAAPYKSKVILGAIAHILMVFFSLGSITILIPVLKIIFQDTMQVTSRPSMEGLGTLKDFLEQSINYWITFYSQEVGKKEVLFWVLVIAASFFLLKNLFRYVGSILMVYIKNGVEKDIRNKIHHKMLHLPVSYFTEQRKGDIAARLTTDILEIQWALLSGIKRLIEDPLMIIGTLSLMLVLSPKLTIFVLLLIPVTGIIITSISRLLKKPSEQAKEEMGRLLSIVEEHIGGIPIIKSYAAEEQAHKAFSQSNQRHFEFMNSMLYRRDLSSPVSEILGSIVIILIIWFGAGLILDQNELEPAMFITYVALFYQIINPAKSLSVAFYDIQRSDASVQRIRSVLDAPNPISDNSSDKGIKASFSNSLKFEQVNFSYTDQSILEDISFDLQKGNVVALVGPSGGGKSTLAYLVNRFYDPTSGRILLDGIDFRDLELKSLRRLVGYISQDPILFFGSVRENLLFGKPEATQEELENAARTAHAHDFIMDLENGYVTAIGD
ncbi:MAG: ABC transporter ATP-binding protein, partial [Saprospiraceae bacterium]|nr:ABC transporter ATP-binding protein [Saprospiraceae bacterium]